MSQQLRTAGDLRGFLADVLIDIREGRIDTDQANAIGKVAAQINQSLATELATALKVKELSGEEVVPGSLVLGSTEIAPERAQLAQPVEGERGNVTAIQGGAQKRWCSQCERNVGAQEATACGSQFCKAKAAA